MDENNTVVLEELKSQLEGLCSKCSYSFAPDNLNEVAKEFKKSVANALDIPEVNIEVYSVDPEAGILSVLIRPIEYEIDLDMSKYSKEDTV